MVYKGNTDAHRKGNAKYLRESVDEIKVRIPKGKKKDIQEHAEKQGESVNGFIKRAIDETMQRDNEK